MSILRSIAHGRFASVEVSYGLLRVCVVSAGENLDHGGAGPGMCSPDCSCCACSGLCTPALPNLRGKSQKVSSCSREYSRFGETVGGDGFDPDCRPTLALRLSQFFRPDCTELGVSRLDCRVTRTSSTNPHFWALVPVPDIRSPISAGRRGQVDPL